jgi:putative transposase
MNRLYQVIGKSKQAVHQWLNREIRRRDEQMQMIVVLRQIREDHPRLSCREIYYMIRPKYMGRDQFERFCHQNGFRLDVKKNIYKTTDSSGVKRFDNNLLQLNELTGVNQVWVSDITYYLIRDEVYYLTFISDLYSRRIVGHAASRSLRTVDTTMVALRMALKERKINKDSNLILHSDGGGQYYCKDFLKMTQGMVNSMGEAVYDNPHAERINGTIKNDYLRYYKPENFEDLKKKLTKAVFLYNTQRPHSSLHRLNPVAFEELTSKGLLTKTWIINKKKKVGKKEKFNISITSKQKTVNVI